MRRLRVAPIVEGHGEYECIRILFERIWGELLQGDYVDVLRPIRQPRTRLITELGLQNAIRLALEKLRNPPETDDPKLVLILLDADEDCPGQLGPRLLEVGLAVDPRADLACVLANVEYETWFVAAAESLRSHLDLEGNPPIPENPEELRVRKAWIQKRRSGGKSYSEAVDQPSMTRTMDLALCRRRSPSFDKLCREFEKRLNREV